MFATLLIFAVISVAVYQFRRVRRVFSNILHGDGPITDDDRNVLYGFLFFLILLIGAIGDLIFQT